MGNNPSAEMKTSAASSSAIADPDFFKILCQRIAHHMLGKSQKGLLVEPFLNWTSFQAIYCTLEREHERESGVEPEYSMSRV